MASVITFHISHYYYVSAFQGVIVTDHSSFHGSRAMVDQHRDMRLDIDEMSYEVLL